MSAAAPGICAAIKSAAPRRGSAQLRIHIRHDCLRLECALRRGLNAARLGKSMCSVPRTLISRRALPFVDAKAVENKVRAVEAVQEQQPQVRQFKICQKVKPSSDVRLAISVRKFPACPPSSRGLAGSWLQVSSWHCVDEP
jgi:hypothetical protein